MQDSIVGKGDEFLVILMAALPLEEVEVPAVRAVGILVAYPRTRLVNRALPLRGVEEHADGVVDLVLLMSEHLLALCDFGEALLRDLGRDAEVLGQPVDVALLHHNAVVAAAIPGAL